MLKIAGLFKVRVTILVDIRHQSVIFQIKVIHKTEITPGVVLQKKVFLKILQISQENTCIGASFNKVASLRPATLLKRDFNTSAFL